MATLLILLLAAVVVVGLWGVLARRHRPARPVREPLGGRSARQIVERRMELEAEDLAQMLAAHNAFRRRRGQPERSLEEVEGALARQPRVATDEDDLESLVAARNARRRARGLPEPGREDVRRRFTPPAS